MQALSGLTGSSALDPVPYDDETYLQKRTFSARSSLALSPDGQWVALVVQGLVSESVDEARTIEATPLNALSEELLGSEVLVVNTQSGQILRPFQSFRASIAPTWSPDGQLALLCQDGERRFPRLTLWQVGHVPRFIEAAPMSPRTAFIVPRWTKDSRCVLFKAATLPSPEPLVVRQSTIDVGPPALPREALGVLDVESGNVQVWGDMNAAGSWLLSPDAKHVAFARAVASPPEARHNQATYRQLVVVDLSDGSERCLGTPQTDNWGASFSWSPDGEAIAWVCAAHQSETQLFVAELKQPETLHALNLPAETEFGWSDVGWYPAPLPLWLSRSRFALPGKGTLWLFTLKTQETEAIQLPASRGFDWFSSSVTAPDFPPLFEAGSATHREVWVMRPNQVCKVDLVTQAVTPVWNLETETAENPAPRISRHWTERVFDRATQQLYTVDYMPDGSITLYATVLPAGKTRRVALVSEGIGQLDSGAIHALTWTLPDGTACSGSLLLPPNWKAGDTPPVVMNVYGDDRGNGQLRTAQFHNEGFVVDLHWLSANGYAVLVPDLPQTDEQPAASLVVAGEAAVQALRTSGLVDADHVALIGSSYGGYTVLCLLTGSNCFQAGIAANGVYDLAYTAVHGGWGWAEAGQGRMRATLWEDPERYRANSPFYALDKLEVPLLIVQGGGDDGGKGGGIPLFAALQRLDKPGELLLYRDAGHAPTSWSIEAQRDLHGRLLHFLAENLAPAT